MNPDVAHMCTIKYMSILPNYLIYVMIQQVTF
jgi:hypothetical protein